MQKARRSSRRSWVRSFRNGFWFELGLGELRTLTIASSRDDRETRITERLLH